MNTTATDPRRIEVWIAMADHFLDTETRQEIPLTALRCIQAGLTVSQARDVWMYEVSPAVAFNVWDVAGEWAAWDRGWLLREIENRRIRDRSPGVWKRLRYRIRVHAMHGFWVSIERCMQVLRECPYGTPEDMAEDLACLARIYFDYSRFDDAAPDSPRRERLKLLYPQLFPYVMEPVRISDEAKTADQRVRSALTSDSDN